MYKKSLFMCALLFSLLLSACSDLDLSGVYLHIDERENVTFLKIKESKNKLSGKFIVEQTEVSFKGTKKGTKTRIEIDNDKSFQILHGEFDPSANTIMLEGTLYEKISEKVFKQLIKKTKEEERKEDLHKQKERESDQLRNEIDTKAMEYQATLKHIKEDQIKTINDFEMYSLEYKSMQETIEKTKKDSENYLKEHPIKNQEDVQYIQSNFRFIYDNYQSLSSFVSQYERNYINSVDSNPYADNLEFLNSDYYEYQQSLSQLPDYKPSIIISEKEFFALQKDYIATVDEYKAKTLQLILDYNHTMKSFDHYWDQLEVIK